MRRGLRDAVGHIPLTALPGEPGNTGLAGHRDTFFRPLKDIKLYDTIRFTNEDGSTEYRVIATRIVGPKDVSAVDTTSGDKLTLITCYPFYYIGPAPKRFIVEATKN